MIGGRGWVQRHVLARLEASPDGIRIAAVARDLAGGRPSHALHASVQRACSRLVDLELAERSGGAYRRTGQTVAAAPALARSPALSRFAADIQARTAGVAPGPRPIHVLSPGVPSGHHASSATCPCGPMLVGFALTDGAPTYRHRGPVRR